MRAGYTPLNAVATGRGATEHWLELATHLKKQDRCSGRIVAVFDRVLYVSLETSVDEPPRVIAIGDSRPGPLLTAVEIPAGHSFDRLNIAAGDQVRLQATASAPPTLHLTVGGQLRLTVDSKALSTLLVDQSLPDLSPDEFQVGATGRWCHRELLEWLLASDQTDGIGWLEALDDHCAEDASSKVDGLLCELRDTMGVGDVCRRLVGRGPGATPAGDDILCGLLVTAWCNRRVRQVVGPAGWAIASEAVGQTPPISRAMLRQASLGRAAKMTRESLRVILSPETLEWWPSPTDLPVLSIGHTSGPALLAGMLTATLAVVPAIVE